MTNLMDIIVFLTILNTFAIGILVGVTIIKKKK